MSYDAKTRTISLTPDSDFLVDSGMHFIHVLRDLAQDPKSSSQIKSDWRIIEGWLGCGGSALGKADMEKFGKALRAYYAIGVAPSHALQPAFDSFSATYKASGQSYAQGKPTEQVMDVFDRMFASDAEIEKKRADDFAVEGKKFAKILGAVNN